MPKTKKKIVPNMAEDVIEIEEEPEEDTGGHSVINPVEACHHTQ